MVLTGMSEKQTENKNYNEKSENMTRMIFHKYDEYIEKMCKFRAE